MVKYIRVTWPQSQYLMKHPHFDECLLLDVSLYGHCAYMCPEDIYNEIFN